MKREQAKQAIMSVMVDNPLGEDFVESYLDNVIAVYDSVPPNLYSNFAAYLNAFRMEYKDRLNDAQKEAVLGLTNLFLNKYHDFS